MKTNAEILIEEAYKRGRKAGREEATRELAPPEPAGRAKVVAAVATGSLPVVEAEALEREWSRKAEWWRERAESARLKERHALAAVCSQAGDVQSQCAAQLGRLIAQSKSRQPEENTKVSHAAQTSNE